MRTLARSSSATTTSYGRLEEDFAHAYSQKGTLALGLRKLSATEYREGTTNSKPVMSQIRIHSSLKIEVGGLGKWLSGYTLCCIS